MIYLFYKTNIDDGDITYLITDITFKTSGWCRNYKEALFYFKNSKNMLYKYKTKEDFINHIHKVRKDWDVKFYYVKFLSI